LLDLRASLIPIAALGGVTLGALAWLAAGRQDTLSPLQERLAAVRPVRATSAAAAPLLAGPPLFALSVGPNAVRDPAVLLMGLSRMPGRSAALVSIDGQPAAWLIRGESRRGVILREVGTGRATVDLPLGVKELRVGEATGGAPVAPGASAAAVPLSTTGDGLPPGFRMPPPPASAPGLGG